MSIAQWSNGVDGIVKSWIFDITRFFKFMSIIFRKHGLNLGTSRLTPCPLFGENITLIKIYMLSFVILDSSD